MRQGRAIHGAGALECGLSGFEWGFWTELCAEICVSTTVVVEITTSTAALIRYYLATYLVAGGLPGFRAGVAEKTRHHAPNTITKDLEGLTLMSNKLRTMIVVCSLAVLAISPASLACDKNKNSSAPSGSQQADVVQVVQVTDGASTCSKSRRVTKTKTVTVADASACATQRTMKTLAKAIYSTKGACGDDCATRAAVVAAYRIMAGANPDFACKATLASLTSGSTCGSAKPTAVLASTGGAKQCCVGQGKAKATKVAAGQITCSKAKARATKVAAAACAAAKAAKVASVQAACSKSKAKATTVANVLTCDPAACAAARASAKATKVSADAAACAAACAAAKAKTIAAGGQAACSKAAKASYVAFGCKKTDRVGRPPSIGIS